MKLAEALIVRADLRKRVDQLRERLKFSAVVQEGETPPESPVELFAEVERVLEQMEGFVRRINRTNLRTTISDGRTLTDALAERDGYSLYYQVLQATADAATPKVDRMGRMEIKKIPTIKVGDLRRQMDDVARKRRELDTQIQAANWATDLLD